jgi:hypothetical protein
METMIYQRCDECDAGTREGEAHYCDPYRH